MKKQRLLKLADFLDQLPTPEKQFDLACWANGPLSLNDCGSAGCALGWATVRFRRQGFVLTGVYSKLPEYQGNGWYHAAVAFFDITYEEAEFLFCPNYYHRGGGTHVSTVTKRIRKFVEKGGCS
jgi:hypothetical protein